MSLRHCKGCHSVIASPKVKGHSVTATLSHYVLKRRHFRHSVTASPKDESSCGIRRTKQEMDEWRGSGGNLWRAKRNQMILSSSTLAWFLPIPKDTTGILVLG